MGILADQGAGLDDKIAAIRGAIRAGGRGGRSELQKENLIQRTRWTIDNRTTSRQELNDVTSDLIEVQRSRLAGRHSARWPKSTTLGDRLAHLRRRDRQPESATCTLIHRIETEQQSMLQSEPRPHQYCCCRQLDASSLEQKRDVVQFRGRPDDGDRLPSRRRRTLLSAQRGRSGSGTSPASSG